MNRELSTPDRDPDDYFQHTRMSFGDHIEDLRRHLLRAIGGFLIAMVLCFAVGGEILRYIAFPLEQQLQVLHDQRRERLKKELVESEEYKQLLQPRLSSIFLSKESLLANGFKLDGPAAKADGDWIELKTKIDPAPFEPLIDAKVYSQIGKRPSLKVFQIQEGLFIWMKVCFVAGFVLASPWVFYQLWAFIAAGLYPHEKKIVHVYLPFAIALFLIGVVFAQFLVIPQAVAYLLLIDEWLGVEPELRLSYWLDFAILIPVVFGFAFQTPLVMFVLDRIGLVTVEVFRKVRRVALFVLTIAAALLCAGDLWSMIMMTVVLCGCYEGGILLCRFIPKRQSELDEAETGDMLEV